MTTETPTQTRPTSSEIDSEPLSGESGGIIPESESEGNQGGSKLHQEAARYRHRAKEAETALAAAQERIAELQRAEVLRLAGSDLADPSDLLALSGRELSEFLTEAGSVDSAAVAEAAAALISSRPGLRRIPPPQLAMDPTQGLGGNPPKPKPSWTSLAADLA